MGSGIAEVCARAGVDVTVVEADDGASERARRGSRSRSTAACGRGSCRPRTARRPPSGSRSRRRRRYRGRRRGDRGDRRERGRQARPVQAARLRAARRGVPRVEHVVGADHEARRGDVEARARARPALLQPRAGAAARRGRALDHDRRRGAGARAAFAQDTLGKVCIDSQDRAGFVVNALLIPYLLSAIRMYESGFASKEDIDEGMIKGCAHPMGPLALGDLIGLDTLLAVWSRSTTSSATRRRWRRRCSTGWSRPGCSAARAGAASTITRSKRTAVHLAPMELGIATFVDTDPAAGAAGARSGCASWSSRPSSPSRSGSTSSPWASTTGRTSRSPRRPWCSPLSPRGPSGCGCRAP